MIQVVVLDWGDTVMRVFPEYEGPMANWPRVARVPGVEEALLALHPPYRLILATNAAESGEPLVRAALRRVGLERYFEAVLTAQELGVCKPDLAFFQALLREVGCVPLEAVMVGDDYQNDVTGAKRAGLWTVWFNPKASPCPLAHPVHDAEAKAMAELPAALEKLRLADTGRSAPPGTPA